MTTVLPVYVSGPLGSEILVYALLDTQSDASFITEDLAKELHLHGAKVSLSMSTMCSGREFSTCNKYHNLSVRGVNETTPVTINSCYERRYIPARRDHIPTRDKVTCWPHLANVGEKFSPLLGVPVQMLIGYNAPSALAPVQTMQHVEGAPHVFRTQLGWTAIGHGGERDQPATVATHRTPVTEECTFRGAGFTKNHRTQTVRSDCQERTRKLAQLQQEIAEMQTADSAQKTELLDVSKKLTALTKENEETLAKSEDWRLLAEKRKCLLDKLAIRSQSNPQEQNKVMKGVGQSEVAGRDQEHIQEIVEMPRQLKEEQTLSSEVDQLSTDLQSLFSSGIKTSQIFRGDELSARQPLSQFWPLKGTDGLLQNWWEWGRTFTVHWGESRRTHIPQKFGWYTNSL